MIDKLTIAKETGTECRLSAPEVVEILRHLGAEVPPPLDDEQAKYARFIAEHGPCSCGDTRMHGHDATGAKHYHVPEPTTRPDIPRPKLSLDERRQLRAGMAVVVAESFFREWTAIDFKTPPQGFGREDVGIVRGFSGPNIAVVAFANGDTLAAECKLFVDAPCMCGAMLSAHDRAAPHAMPQVVPNACKRFARQELPR